MDILIKAFEIMPEFPAIDVLKPANEVEAFVPSLKQQSTAIHVDDDHFTDDYLAYINDEKDLARYSLDDIDFDHEEEKVVEKEVVIEQLSANKVTDVQKEETTPLKEDVEHQMKNSPYINVVVFNDRPCLETVFCPLKLKNKKSEKARKISKCILRSIKARQKKSSVALISPYVQQSSTTLARRKTRSTTVNKEMIVMSVFLEDLSRPHNCKRDKVIVPDSIRMFLKQKQPPEYQFPWGRRDIVVGRRFWLALSCLENCKDGWLHDSVSNLHAPSNADWAMVSPHFPPSILGGNMVDFYSNGKRYPVPWRDVRKVYFPVNEPGKHWCLAEVQLRTGVVSFYDTLGWVQGNSRRWWRNMKRRLPEQLTLYLNEHGVLQSKGITVENYEITYQFPYVPYQVDLFGDCGVWVCIILYRSSRNRPMEVDDPLETALAYRERMLE